MVTTHGVETALNLLGILAFALSGALLGVRRQFDIVGMAVLATVTAIGGGIIRDVMIGAVPPAALNNPSWLVLPLVATLLTFRWHPQVRRMHRAVELFDAVGLGVFCATATVKAIDYGVHPLAAVLLGCITGVGGGLIRDVLAGVTPAVLRKDSRLYVVPAVVGCAIVADRVGVRAGEHLGAGRRRAGHRRAAGAGPVARLDRAGAADVRQPRRLSVPAGTQGADVVGVNDFQRARPSRASSSVRSSAHVTVSSEVPNRPDPASSSSRRCTISSTTPARSLGTSSSSPMARARSQACTVSSTTRRSR